MIPETLARIDLLAWTEASLVLFLAVFVAVIIRTVRTDRSVTQQQAALVFEDPAPTHRQGDL
jgi:hypothetical protein